MIMNNEYQASRLPSEYQECEWIGIVERGGCIVISNDEFLSNKSKLKLEYKISYEDNKTNQYYFRSRFVACWYYSGQYRCRAMTNTANGIPYTKSGSHEFSIFATNSNGRTNNTQSINRTLNSLTDVSYGTITNSNKFEIFGPSDGYTTGKIYYMKYELDDVKYFDLVPCYRKSDNEIGMYDLVNGVFYTNQGTGTFTKGADIGSGGIGRMKQKLKGAII